MGRLSNEKKMQLERKDLDKEKILQTIPCEQGEGEEFACTVKRASNGFILEGKGEILVFSEEKYVAALQWIIQRRLLKMKQGEEMGISLKQIFTKVLPPCSNEKQPSEQLVA
jgi:hypothetical protein